MCAIDARLKPISGRPESTEAVTSRRLAICLGWVLQGLAWQAAGFELSADCRADEPPTASAAATEKLAPSPSQTHFQLAVVDQAGQPIAGASVITLGAKQDEDGRLPRLTEATTAIDGTVSLDLSSHADSFRDDKPSALVWKPGREIRSVLLPTEQPLVLPLLGSRTLRITDPSGHPVGGARVALADSSTWPQLPAAWTAETACETDSLGLCRLGCPTRSTVLTARVQLPGKEPQTVSIRQPSRLDDPTLDASGTVFVCLAPTGSISGQVPPALSGVTRIHLQPASTTFSSLLESNAFSRGTVEPDADGQFQFADVAAGTYHLRAERKLSTGTDQTPSMAAENSLAPYVDVAVEPDNVTDVEWPVVTAAKVVGRVVSDQADADYATTRIVISSIESNPGEAYPRTIGLMPGTVCNAQGEYETVLPVGSYRIEVAATEDWRRAQPVTVTVGPGAAMLRASDIELKAGRRVSVRLADDARQMLSELGNPRATVLAYFDSPPNSYRTQFLGRVSPDSWSATVPLDAALKEIFIQMVEGTNLSTRVVDLDPSPDFELALDRRTDATQPNVALRVRVVDEHGKGLGRVPVRLTSRVKASGGLGSSSLLRPRAILTISLARRLVTDADGWIVLPPVQLLPSFSRISTFQRYSGLSVVVLAETLVGDGFSRSDELPMPATVDAARQRPIQTAEDAANAALPSGAVASLPSELILPDIVLKQAPAVRAVAGRLLSADGKPLVGRTVWLANAPGLIRGVTDSQGEFRFDHVLAGGWLLSDVNWTIQKIADLPEKVEIREGSAPPKVAAAWQRLPLEQRRKLATEQLDKLRDGAGGPGRALAMRSTTALPPEAYLDRDKFWDTLVRDRFGDASLDVQRLAFAGFWTELGAEELRKLSDSAGSSSTRATLLKMLGDRTLDVSTYEEALNAVEIEPPPVRTRPGGRQPNAPPVFVTTPSASDELVIELAAEMFRHGLLEPHRGKLEVILERHRLNRERIGQRVAEAYEPSSLTLCRALLDPRQFLDAFEPPPPGEDRSLIQDRSARRRSLETMAQLFPEKSLDWPADQFPGSWTVWRSLGKTMPLTAVQRLGGKEPGQWKSPRNRSLGWQRDEAPFIICQTALRVGHPDARAASEELCRSIRNLELTSPSYSSTQAAAAVWCQEVEASAPELARQAKWHLALQNFNVTESSIEGAGLMTGTINAAGTLKTALCISDLWPDLADELVSQTATRVRWKFDFERPQPSLEMNTGPASVSLLTYYRPELSVEILEKLTAEAVIDQADPPAAPGAAALAARAIDGQIIARRLAIVRGLLLSPQQLVAFP
ncbi:MAG: hypothetical protein ACTHOU_06140 [Aureliella sp.]